MDNNKINKKNKNNNANNDNDTNPILNALGLVGLAGIGGTMGYLYAGLFTAAEIVAVSSPVGIVCGAVFFVALALDADNNNK